MLESLPQIYDRMGGNLANRDWSNFEKYWKASCAQGMSPVGGVSLSRDATN